MTIWHHVVASSPQGIRLRTCGVFFLTLVLLGMMLPSQGLTDDDDFYAPAGIRYAAWLGDAITSPGEAFTQTSIDSAFRINREHPPFAKYIIGIAHAVSSKWLPLYTELDGARMGVVFLCALLCAFLYRLCVGPFRETTALFAVLALCALPRFVFHSQVATLDVPVATMVVLTTAAFFWGERSSGWAWGCGIIFGLAMLTKLNAPFAAIPATLYAILCRWRGFGLGPQRISLQIPPIPRSLVAMLVLGPIVFVVGWPWLWFDGIKRFSQYVAFHMGHYPIYLFYEGEVYTKPFAPWHAPFTFAAGVIPLPLLVLGLLGAVSACIAFWRLVYHADEVGEVPALNQREKLITLVLLQAIFAIGAVAFSPVPKYGGEKLFMPFFPLFAILVAEGWTRLGEYFHILGSERWFSPPQRRLAWMLCAALTLLPGYWGSMRFYGGFALSYYAEALGGLRGATARGYERTYYDIADKELARWLDEHLAPDERVHFAPNHKEYARTYRWLKKDGYISRRVVLESRKEKAALVVLTHERRWQTYPGLLEELRNLPVVYEKRIDGVPLYTVYRRAKR